MTFFSLRPLRALLLCGRYSPVRAAHATAFVPFVLNLPFFYFRAKFAKNAKFGIAFPLRLCGRAFRKTVPATTSSRPPALELHKIILARTG